MWNRDSAAKGDVRKEARPGPPLPAEERRVIAWVGKSVMFTGTLVSSEDITIDGQVEGTVEVRDHGLTVGPHADIHADIAAMVVTIHGAVTGNVRATVKVEIRETGRVEGNVTAPLIAIVEGAAVHGRVSTETASSDAMPRDSPAAVALIAQQ